MHAFLVLRLVSRLMVCLALAAPWAAVHAQTPAARPVARESEVKAAYLYKFAAFVEWPAGVFSAPDSPLVIGVVGDDAVAADLALLIRGRDVEGRPVSSRVVIDAKGASGVHILLVGDMREAKAREYMPPPEAPVLVVTEQDGGLHLGSSINLVSDGGRVRFSASPGQAQARGLKLSSRLLAVAQSVEGKTAP